MERYMEIVFDDATYKVDFEYIRKLYLEKMGYIGGVYNRNSRLIEQFFSDDVHVVRWVNQYLDWDDIKEQVTLLKKIPPDYNDEWLLAHKSIKENI